MDEDQDLERCDEIKEKATTGDLRQRRVNTQRHRHAIGLRRRSITRLRASTAGTANFAAHLVSVGLLFSFFSILIGLIQVKYQNRDASPYKTHPLNMAICLAALCICALAVGSKMMVQTTFGNWAAHIINRTILISGVLVIVAIVSVLVTNWLSWIIYIIWAIFSVMVMAWNSIDHLITMAAQRKNKKGFFSSDQCV